MDFEYGCSTTNKFCFLDENEVEDPSDLLAQVKDAKEQTKDTKTGKDGKAKPKSADAKAKAGKDAKKQPLQQQTDNSVKKTGDLKTDAKKPVGQVKSAQTGTNQPREDKENTSRQGGQGQRTGDNQIRRPRPEGAAGEGFRGNQDGTRPPRQNRPRPEGQQGDQRGPRPDRPPRQNRPRPEGGFENVEGQMVTDDANNVEGEGFRRTSGTGGGYRGARGAGGVGGERRGAGAGGYRGAGNGGGGFRQRRSNDPDHPREFDRHSGSEKTGIKAVDKKEGAGKGNWGTATDELAAEGEVLNDTQGEATTENQNWAERVDESEEKREDETDESKEQHPNFMTLDEYKALKNQVNKRNDFNIRKPGEGEDLSKWGKTYVLPKKPADEEDEEEEDEEEEAEEEIEEDAEDEKKKNLLNSIQIKFYDSGADRRGDRRPGGDRRGDRPGGERRGDRPEGQQQRRPRPAQEGEPAAAVTPLSPSAVPVETANPQQTTDETSSPSAGDKQQRPRFNNNRGGSQQQRGGNNNQRRGPRDGPGQSRGSQKAAPKFDDEKDFPSLGK